MSNEGFMVTGEEGANLFQLHAVRGALKLEKLGMRHSKVGSIRKGWALRLGLKANAKYDEVIAAINQRIKEIEDRGNFKVESF